MVKGAEDVRVVDAKEVGVGNPAEETFYHPNARIMAKRGRAVKSPICGIWRGTLTWVCAMRDCAFYG